MLKLALIATVAGLALAGPAAAQATRTWVSGVGDDANPCSRTAPCKTFAGAISKTAAGGEISVLDPGGFGAIHITKSISINAEWGGEGGILAALTNGVIVNGAGITVNLRGLMIEGATNGLNGVRVLQGAAVHIQNCVVRGFNSSSAGAGNGIIVANSAGNIEVDITDTLIEDNGSGAVGAGIAIKPTGTGGAHVTMTRVQVFNNPVGITVDGDNATGPINVAIVDSQVSGNTGNGFNSLSPNNADSLVKVTIDSSLFQTNGTIGVQSVGQRSTVRIGRSTVTANGNAGLQANNQGILQSYGDNFTEGNGAANVGVTPANPS